MNDKSAVSSVIDMPKSDSGFTLIEVIVALFILIAIGALGIRVFYTARTPKTLEVITDGLVSKLNETRAGAMASRYNSSHGIFFASTSYTIFPGSSYSPSNASNTSVYLPEGWKLATSTGNPSSQIIFSRLSGIASATSTITISSLASPTTFRSVKIGASGNVSVVK